MGEICTIGQPETEAVPLDFCKGTRIREYEKLKGINNLETEFINAINEVTINDLSVKVLFNLSIETMGFVANLQI